MPRDRGDGKDEREVTGRDKQGSRPNAALPDSAPGALTASDPNTASEKPLKKEKKSSKQSNGNMAHLANSTAVIDPLSATDGKAEKKAKKAKKAAAMDGAGRSASLMAAVGSVELAMSSQKLVKNLYKENQAVSQMTSSELQKWQQERSISIVGNARNPVLAFQQSGGQAVLHWQLQVRAMQLARSPPRWSPLVRPWVTTQPRSLQVARTLRRHWIATVTPYLAATSTSSAGT